MNNRKKHSLLKRRSLVGLSLLTLLTIVTCAPVTPQRAIVVKLPPAAKQQSAQPAVSEARRLTGEAATQGARAADQVSRAGKGLQATQREMQQLVETAARLRQQKAASENDLLQLYNKLVEQEKRMTLLVMDIGEAEVSLADALTKVQQVSVKLSDAEALVAAKDAEAMQLRDQLIYMNDVAEAQRQMADQNATLASKESARADRVTGESKLKTKLLIGTGSLLLVTIFVIVLLVRSRLPI